MYLLPISGNEAFSPAQKLFVFLILLSHEDNQHPDFWSNFLKVLPCRFTSTKHYRLGLPVFELCVSGHIVCNIFSDLF